MTYPFTTEQLDRLFEAVDKLYDIKDKGKAQIALVELIGIAVALCKSVREST
jgi:hypothetical protein